MFPPPQFSGQRPLSPGAARVRPGPPVHNWVHRPVSSSCDPPPGPPSGTPGRPLIRLPTNRFQLPAEPREELSQGLWTYPHCWRFPTIITMQMMWAMIPRTWAVEKATHQSAWSKTNSPWSNLPKGWRRPTLMNSTSGRKYGWLGFWRRSIGPLSGGRNRLKQLRDGPLHWEKVVTVFLDTFNNWLPLVDFSNTEWINRQ